MIPNKNTGGYFATHYDEIIHWLMACYAGFGGMYSVVLHARNFVNAQTGNLMSITEDFLGGDFFSVMTRVGALIMFAAGVVVSFLLSQKIHPLGIQNVSQKIIFFIYENMNLMPCGFIFF